MWKISVAGFSPIGKMLLVNREEANEKEGSVWLPETSRYPSLIAEVLNVGEDVDELQFLPGSRVICSANELILPFLNERMGVCMDYTLYAVLKGERDKEKIVPLNGGISVKPDVRITEMKGIFLPDQSIKPRTTGTVIRVADGVESAKAGDSLVYQPSLSFPVIEQGEEVHLMGQALGKFERKKGRIVKPQPIGAVLLVKIGEKETKKGIINLPDGSIAEPPVGKILSVGDAVKSPRLKKGTKVLLLQTATGMRNPGEPFDMAHPSWRLVNEADVLGVYE